MLLRQSGDRWSPHTGSVHSIMLKTGFCCFKARAAVLIIGIPGWKVRCHGSAVAAWVIDTIFITGAGGTGLTKLCLARLQHIQKIQKNCLKWTLAELQWLIVSACVFLYAVMIIDIILYHSLYYAVRTIIQFSNHRYGSSYGSGVQLIPIFLISKKFVVFYTVF